MKQIKKADDSDMAAAAHIDLELVPGELETADNMVQDQVKLAHAAKIARWLVVFLTLALLVLWPMPMLGSNYVFSKPFFTGWVSFDIIWLFFTGFAVCVFPVFQGRKTIAKTFKSIYLDITGKRKPGTMHGRPVVADEMTAEEAATKKGLDTPPEKAVDSA